MHDITSEGFEHNLEIPFSNMEIKTWLLALLDMAWRHPERYVIYTFYFSNCLLMSAISRQACRIFKPIYRGSGERKKSPFCRVRLSLPCSWGSNNLTQSTDLQVYLIITIAYEPILVTSIQRLDVQARSSPISRINVSIEIALSSESLLIEVSVPSEVATARVRPIRKPSTPFSLLGQHRPPLFEKSNVLVLYVIRLSLFFSYWLLLFKRTNRLWYTLLEKLYTGILTTIIQERPYLLELLQRCLMCHFQLAMPRPLPRWEARNQFESIH